MSVIQFCYGAHKGHGVNGVRVQVVAAVVLFQYSPWTLITSAGSVFGECYLPRPWDSRMLRCQCHSYGTCDQSTDTFRQSQTAEGKPSPLRKPASASLTTIAAKDHLPEAAWWRSSTLTFFVRFTSSQATRDRREERLSAPATGFSDTTLSTHRNIRYLSSVEYSMKCDMRPSNVSTSLS